MSDFGARRKSMFFMEFRFIQRPLYNKTKSLPVAVPGGGGIERTKREPEYPGHLFIPNSEYLFCP